MSTPFNILADTTPVLPSGLAAFSIGALLVGLIIGLVIFIFVIILYWRIVSKAGYPGAMSLLLLIPFVNFIMIIVFAFSEWPIQREVNQLRAMAARGGSGTQFPSSPQYPAYGQPGQPGQPQYGQPGQQQYRQPGQPQHGQPGQPPQYPQPGQSQYPQR